MKYYKNEEIDILFHYVKELLVDGDWSSYLLEYDAVIGFTHRDELLDAIDDMYNEYKNL